MTIFQLEESESRHEYPRACDQSKLFFRPGRRLVAGRTKGCFFAGAVKCAPGPLNETAISCRSQRRRMRKLLNPEQYMVMRRFGTEAAGSCALNHEKRAGTFVCAGCDQPLFVSKTKYESNTGWPSFTHPIDGAVGTKKDPVYGDLQVEVHCRQCGSHLGHVFPDGPPRPICAIASMVWQ